jgi:hypothetical protein
MSEPTPTPEPIPNPEPTPQPGNIDLSGLISPDGTFSEGFYDALPEDLGQHSYVQKYKSIQDVFKGGINQNQLVGKKAEDFWTSEDEEIVARRREIMGVPKDVSGYEYKVTDLPEGMPTDIINQRIEAAKEKFLELGIPAEKAQALLEWDINGAVEQWDGQIASSQASVEQAESELRKEWKGSKFEYNVGKAKNALEHLGLSHWSENPAFGNNPEFIKDVFDKIVPLISDDTIIEARQSQNMATMEDNLNDLETRIYAMPAEEKGTPQYRRLLDQRMEILNKMEGVQ